MDVLLKNLLRVARPLWRGPAIEIKLPTAPSLKLGRGQTQARLELNGSISLLDLLRRPSLTFGEAYMNQSLRIRGDIMIVLRAFHENKHLFNLFGSLSRRHLPAKANVKQSVANARHHYDISNDFYKLWLDPSLTYSCAYFPTGREILSEAQFAKRELISQKLQLEQSDFTLLDIGCGWGSLLFHVAERYGAVATGITPVPAQANYIQAEISRRGLHNRVRVICGDWRQHDNCAYDRLVSVGMFEHVGPTNYAVFFRHWRRLLKPASLSLLHTIGHTRPAPPDPWITKYIFPGGYLPTAKQIRNNSAAAGLVIPPTSESGLPTWHNLKPHYSHTLALWSQNLAAAKPTVINMFDERFYRMWSLYLKASQAGFRWGDLQLYQVILTPKQRGLTNLVPKL